jgi:CheY-like chemotaxis protein
MSRTVLLVEPDLDVLAALASKLRSRGLSVALADTANGLLDRARAIQPNALLLSEALTDAAGLAERVQNDCGLANTRCFILVDAPGEQQTAALQLGRSDVDSIVKELYALPSRPPAGPVQRDDFRGDLCKLSVPDLLQLLSMNRRTGSLSVSVPSGAGAVRLIDGEVVDAVFRRLEAEKALYRLLGESEGTFAFSSGQPAPVRRIATPTNVLLMEGMSRMDEVRRRRKELALEGEALVSTSTPDEQPGELARRVIVTLLVPHTVDELLDSIGDPDHAILEVLQQLLRVGKVRRIPKTAVRVAFAEPEQMAVLGALANRLRPRGYAGPARLVLAVPPGRLAALTHSVQRIAEATSATDAVSSLPLPCRLATVRLGENAELEIVGLPAVESYCPTWGLALGGCAAAVRLGCSGGGHLEEACAVSGVMLLDGETLVGDLDVTDPAQIAALIRASLEALAGG